MLKSQTKFKKSNEVIMLPARFIQPNPHQPRKSFNWDDLEGLAESIHYNGLLQPITVRKKENGKYELISGERRLRACKMAGLSAIPSIIVDVDEEKSAILAVIEKLEKSKITFTVAECGEFHSLGRYRDDISNAEEAIAVWKEYQKGPLNGIPSIGIRIYKPGQTGRNRKKTRKITIGIVEQTENSTLA